MQLEHLMTMRADLKPPINVGAGPSGVRQIFDVAGGTFEGPRLRGTIVPGGGDWFRIGADGVGRLDVRATLRTDDGAHIYVRYEGIFEFAKVVAKLGRGEETEFGEA